ncbi:phage tail tape measure protein [Roseovarius sp. TE539]|uniref:phage tail tape measure C-terminal domain-containing protein n=1 Tax=Roseovarius sp. TE539 TaxID=2249812 RepID=UPI000DE08656|nr:phage tail tape measure C-terminal domain-containing protein [Roseovarius sp. TE539]RBI69047.1 phage tail tape measure protein [Roseovarius sp. TE539]
MAEKRVSVRLSATGGRQVKDALRGVGEAGQQGFRRLSREMEAANRRLARFARQATRIARVVGAAAAAAGAALIRSGLQTIDAQAKLAQSLATTTASVQVLARAADLSGNSFRELEAGSARLTRRLSLFAADGSGPAADAIRRLGLNAAELLALPLDQRIARVTEAIRQNAASEQAALFSQLFGDRAFVAFQRLDPAQLRQANDELRRFGVLVRDADADRIEETNDAISRLGLLWRGLSNQLAVAAAPALQSAAEGLARLGEVGGPIQRVFTGISDALVLLIDNVGRVASTAAAFAGFLAGRWVARMAAATLSVRGLATALVVLRGALIRTGIGALIVGAGELIYQFTRLVAATGGIGAALGLLKDVAAEAWDRIALRAGAAWARVEAGWAAAQASIYEGLQGATEAVVGWGNSTVATFAGAFEAVKATWGALPEAIGDFAFQAANALIDGVESMINGVVDRINRFITRLNAALSNLPEWATGEGGLSIGRLDPVELGGVENPFAGAASAVGDAAGEAFRAAMGRAHVEAPDLFGGMAADARGRAAGYAEAAGMLTEAAARPMTAWRALKDVVAATDSADRFEEALGAAGQAATEAGAAAGAAAAAAAPSTERAVTGWQAVTAALSDYATKARSIGGDIGQSLVGAFRSAENAVARFVKTGKLDFRDLVTSLLADLAKLAARRFILGPIAGALSGALGGLGGKAGGIFADVLHAGGRVGAAGPARRVPAMAFADAPRMHSGGMAGLKPDEVPAILQRGERVLSRRETRAYDGARGERDAAPIVNVTIQTRDAESFRQSRTQVASDIARAVAMGRRGM